MVDNIDILENGLVPEFSFGRKKIYAYVNNINRNNVREVVHEAYKVHEQNIIEINWLFNLFRGKDNRIVDRTRKINNGVNEKIVVNYNRLIAEYRANTFMQNSPLLINRTTDKTKSELVSELISYHEMSSKFSRDKEAALHAAICGVSYRFIEPNINYDGLGQTPVNRATLNPASVMRIYGDDTQVKPLATVYINQIPKGSIGAGDVVGETTRTTLATMANRYTVYTDTYVYDFYDNEAYATNQSTDNITITDAPEYGCPIIEYKLNPFMMGSFEDVQSLIYLLSLLKSDSANNIVQTVASILVLKNANIPMDDSEESVAYRDTFFKELQEKLMLIVDDGEDREFGAEYISPKLSQADAQILYDSTLGDISALTKIPQNILDGGGGGNVGNAELSGGWIGSLLEAANAEPYWSEEMYRELMIELYICHKKNKLLGINVEDIRIEYQRRGYSNKQSEAQTFATLLGTGLVNPVDAAVESNICIDPQSFIRRGLEWREQEKQRIKETVAEEEPNVPTESIVVSEEPNVPN